MQPIQSIFSLKIIHLACLLGICLAPAGAIAHTPYLVPNLFEPLRGGMITLDASFTEKFFVPEVNFDGGEFAVINPDGSRSEPDQRVSLQTRLVVEHKLTEDGTYRFTTGKRLGAIFTVYEEDGETKTARGRNQDIPAGATIIEKFQALTIAETYVSKGAPNRTALKPGGEGLEILAQTHPNDLFAGDDFEMQLLMNGKPLPGATVDVFRAQYQFGSDKADLTLQTDDKGELSVPLEKQGVYLLQIRHRAPAPEGAGAPLYSHTYTLVLEAYN